MHKDGEACLRLQGNALYDAVIKTVGEAELRRARYLPADKLQPLYSLGVADLTDLVEPGTYRLITVLDLKKRYRGAKRSHQQALLYLTALLNRAPGEGRLTARLVPTNPDLHQRTMHPAYRQTLDELCPRAPDKVVCPVPRAQAPITEYAKPLPRQQGRRQPPPVPQEAAAALQEAARREDQLAAGTREAAPPDTGRRQRTVGKRHRPSTNRVTLAIQGGAAGPAPRKRTRQTLAKHTRYQLVWTEVLQRLPQHTNDTGGEPASLQAAARRALTALQPRPWEVEAILARRATHALDDAGEKVPQFQVQVQWVPSVHQAWEVELYKLLGYLPSSPPEELEDPCEEEDYDAPCEYCCKCEGRGVYCDACNRWYHIGCLSPGLPSEPEGDWLCPECMAAGPHVADAPHMRWTKVCRVKWQPSFEPEHEMRQQGWDCEIEELIALAERPLPQRGGTGQAGSGPTCSSRGSGMTSRHHMT